MRFATRLSGLACALVAFASICSAATISGTVKGPEGTPFEGAFVGAQNSKTKITVSVLSDKQGHYQVRILRAGDYEFAFARLDTRPIRSAA